ncbi:MAG: selenide, water dikinase SelD [Chloroflexi bacterium]|nr:selenide, water dikinase SelD [Chloroflexota bacterium]
MRPLSTIFKPADFPNLLVGLGQPDDAAVYRINDTTAIIQTMDFFPPVVDDAYAFGAIAAANAMSDVYAMGGEVLLALNIAAWREELPLELFSEILRGAADKVAEAGAVIAGGHTITDDEPKFGLSVTGTVHPNHITRKGGARVGDMLVLTKPLGSGLITTAGKNGVASDAHLQNAIAWMTQLNRGAAQAMRDAGAECATDITGYGLLGHAYEIADASSVALRFHADTLPVLDGALEYARQKQIPGGAGRNRLYLDDKVHFAREFAEDLTEIFFDPQTSGGLLIAVSPTQLDTLIRSLDARRVAHWVVGESIAHEPNDNRRIVVD